MGIKREKDFILRLTEEMAKVIAAVLGLRKAQQPALALEKISEAGGDLLGVPKSVLDRVDEKSAVRMLEEPVRLRMYARLLREEAEILAELQRDGSAQRARAIAMLAEAAQLDGIKPEDERELALLRG